MPIHLELLLVHHRSTGVKWELAAILGYAAAYTGAGEHSWTRTHRLPRAYGFGLPFPSSRRRAGRTDALPVCWTGGPAGLLFFHLYKVQPYPTLQDFRTEVWAQESIPFVVCGLAFVHGAFMDPESSHIVQHVCSTVPLLLARWARLCLQPWRAPTDVVRRCMLLCIAAPWLRTWPSTSSSSP